LYHSTLGSRVIKKKRRDGEAPLVGRLPVRFKVPERRDGRFRVRQRLPRRPSLSLALSLAMSLSLAARSQEARQVEVRRRRVGAAEPRHLGFRIWGLGMQGSGFGV